MSSVLVSGLGVPGVSRGLCSRGRGGFGGQPVDEKMWIMNAHLTPDGAVGSRSDFGPIIDSDACLSWRQPLGTHPSFPIAIAKATALWLRPEARGPRRGVHRTPASPSRSWVVPISRRAAALLASVEGRGALPDSPAVGMYGGMALAHFAIFGRGLPKTRPVFWVMMQIGMLLGFATAYPVNWFLPSRRGVKEAMYWRPGPRKPSLGIALWAVSARSSTSAR